METVERIKTRRVLEGLSYKIYLFFFYKNDREWRFIKFWDESRKERQHYLNNMQKGYPSVREG